MTTALEGARHSQRGRRSSLTLQLQALLSRLCIVDAVVRPACSYGSTTADCLAPRTRRALCPLRHATAIRDLPPTSDSWGPPDRLRRPAGSSVWVGKPAAAIGRCRCGSTAPSWRLMPSRHWGRPNGTLPVGWRHHLLIAGPEPHRSWALASQARGVDLLVYRRVGLTAQKTDPIPKPARLLEIHGRGCGLHPLSKILQLGIRSHLVKDLVVCQAKFALESRQLDTLEVTRHSGARSKIWRIKPESRSFFFFAFLAMIPSIHRCIALKVAFACNPQGASGSASGPFVSCRKSGFAGG